MTSLTEKFPTLQKFDISQALEVGWKGYAANIGMGALVLFLGMLLMMLAMLTGVGIFLALPHLAASLSIAGYYMARGKIDAGVLFVGFRKYGRIIGAMLIVWLLYTAISALCSGPYYYHLIQAMSPEVAGDAAWPQRFVAASLNPDVQTWVGFAYLAYPLQFYLQARLLPLFPLLIDENATVGEAFAHSWRMTSKVQWYLFLLMFLTMIISFVAVFSGMIALIVGMFFTLPFPMVLIGAGTRQLMESGAAAETA